MDRISKLLILGWAVVALLVECYYVSGSWWVVRVLGPGLLVASAIAAAIDRRAVAPVAAVAYVLPVLVGAAAGRFHATFLVVWLSALLGLVLPDALRHGWNLPERWRAPLVCWVGGVSATAPIIMLRAVDFRWELLFRGRLPTEALGGLPLLTVGWVLHVALLLAVGALWFDWLCGQARSFFERWVMTPFASSAVVLGLVACYQLFVDVQFLNHSLFGSIGRAAGTMLDGNVAGAIATFWMAGWGVRVTRASGAARLAACGVVLLLWLSVWATGSRTAFALSLIVSGVPFFGWLRTRVSIRTAFLATLVGGIVIGGSLFVLLRTNPRVVGPIARIQQTLPAPTTAGAAAFARSLWERDGYGTAAVRAIAAYPWFGIGVGSFYEMAGEFGGWLPPDNAQNWYRHQLAELGVVGSLGWATFVAAFGWWVLRRHPGEEAGAWPLRGALLGIAVISLLGMPGQDPVVAVTLWTFAAWYLHVAGRPPSVAQAGRGTWIVVAAIVLVFAAGTAQLAAGRLRLPARIQRLGGEYLYGFYWPEPDGEGGEYRWARRHATAVVPAPTRSVELTLRINHADLAQHPTRVRAWVDGRSVIDTVLTSGADSVTKAVMLPMGEQRVLVDASADRAVVAPPPDGRELAMMVRWRFVPSSR